MLAIPVLFLLYFYGLTNVGMVTPDEPRYAAIGREMALSGDWVTPRLWGSAWFEKPALLYWMIGLGNRMGLDADLAPRLPVALLSVWFLIFYFFRMRREFGERAAWFSSAMLATSAGWLAFSHVAVTDIPLAATFSASMLLALPWVRSGGRRGLVIAGVLLGLAVLAKGLVPIVLAVPLLWVGRRRWMDLLLFGAAAAITAAPWYLLCYVRNGQAFIDAFFWRHHFSRFFSPELQHVQPWWYYIPIMAGMLFPWTPMLTLVRTLEWREPRRLLLISWILFGLLFFSVSSNKLPGYILPLLPAVTSLAGIQFAASPVRWVAGASSLLLAGMPGVAAILPEAISAGLSRSTPDRIDWGVAAFLTAAAIAVILLERRSFALAFGATALATSVCVLWITTVTFPRMDQVASARPAWRAAGQNAESLCLDEVTRSFRYGLNYYAGRELPLCSNGREDNHGILDRDRDQSR